MVQLSRKFHLKINLEMQSYNPVTAETVAV
jgi:hypothetical protein